MSDDAKMKTTTVATNDDLPSGDELAAEVMGDATSAESEKVDSSNDVEVAESDKLAETLGSLQNLIEKHAEELTKLNREIAEKRSSLKSVFENDAQLAEAQTQLDQFSATVKERRSQMQSNPQIVNLKVQIAEINEQKKEIEETLSNHLVNYHSLTNSTSFDTSDGDQWEFSIRAKIKPRK
ncbi:MAG: hypothetical protein ACOZAN_03090 [Patescibacteria group bacterium]